MARISKIQTFYASDKWRNLRISLIAQRGNRCECCGEHIAKSIEIIAHHKTELTAENVDDYNISLNPNEIELICFDCHNQEHERFGYQPQKKVYLVYGPPMSGKNTFVRQQIKRGDIVVDMDRLYEAMSMLPSYDKPDSLYTNIRSIHNTLIDSIKTRFGKWRNAWVIGGYPDRYKRERLADELGAELIFCECSLEECMRRLQDDSARSHVKVEWEKYIQRWFEKYS